jgi:hypothetical protein
MFSSYAPQDWTLEKKATVIEDIVKPRNLVAGYLAMRK